MNTDLNFHTENNTTPGRQIKKKIKLSKEVSANLYALVNGLYNKHAKKGTESLTIKTFIKVQQKEFNAGDRVPLIPEEMSQKVELENFNGDKEEVRLK